MAKIIRIGIVGCGAIGSSLAKCIISDFKKRAGLSGVYDSDIQKALILSGKLMKKRNSVFRTLLGLIGKSDLIVEAASAKSAYKIAEEVLSAGRDILIMSVGGVVEKFSSLLKLAERNNAHIYIPSGAICGVDGVKALAMGKIKKITLTTIKHPNSFKGVSYLEKQGIILSKIKKDTLLFEGSAKQAIVRFPQNINVAGILSIAGIGLTKTKVRIIASPSSRKNVHEIQIDSNAARIITRTENIVHPSNPKTSYLAVLSAIASLKQVVSPVRIGT